MVSSEKQILSKVLSKAECCVVTGDQSDFVVGFLSHCEDTFSESSILPVCVDCKPWPDSLSIWKAIAKGVEDHFPSVYEGNDVTEMFFSVISDTEDTDDVQSYLSMILNEISENCGWRILLVMENFESAIERMEEFDIMKLRELAKSLTLMTISRSPWVEVSIDKYKNPYFYNQFETFFV